MNKTGYIYHTSKLNRLIFEKYFSMKKYLNEKIKPNKIKTSLRFYSTYLHLRIAKYKYPDFIENLTNYLNTQMLDNRE